MDWADDVTYSVHDLEDFYRAGRLPLHLLAQRDSPEREEFFENVFERRRDDSEFAAKSDLKEAFTSILVSTFSLPRAYDGSSVHRAALRRFTAILIGRYINAANLTQQDGGRVSLSIDDDLRAEVTMLKELTWTYVIEAVSLAGRQQGQKRVIDELFAIFSQLSQNPRDWIAFPNVLSREAKGCEWSSGAYHSDLCRPYREHDRVPSCRDASSAHWSNSHLGSRRYHLS